MREKHLKRVAKDREEGLADLRETYSKSDKKGKTHQKRVGDWGEKAFADRAMKELPLDLIKTRKLDRAGTDNLFTFQISGNGPGYPFPPELIGEGEIHTQIKTSCLREYQKSKQKHWKFRIIRINKELDDILWSQSDFFLGLVLLWCRPEEFTGDEPPSGTRRIMLLIPGKNIVKFFQIHKTAKHIRLYQKMFERGGYKFHKDGSKFLDGADDIETIFNNQMDEQREKILEDWELQRGWEE